MRFPVTRPHRCKRTMATVSRQHLSQAAFGALFVLVILVHAAYLTSPDYQKQSWSDRGMQQLHNSALFQLLQTASAKAAERSATFERPSALQLDPQCQLPEAQLQGVLAAAQAAAASLGAPGAIISGHHARAAALKLRAQLQREWADALAPYASEEASTAARSCKSVGLLQRGPVVGNRTNDRTALLLVMDSWKAFDHLMSLYSINLVTIWAYARLHGYGLELYVQGEPPLPQHMPVYFIKVTGVRHLFDNLGYQHVLYLDFDTFTSPHSAPPLSLLYGEFPAASLLMQAEHNMCAAAMLWRNTPDADMLLQAWWDVGVSGCCPTFPHDQTALKHMLLMYLANVTGHSWLYPYSMRRRFKLPATPPPAAAMPVAPAAGPAAAGAPPGSRPLTAVAAATAAAAAPPKQQRQHKQQHKQKKLRVLSKDHMPHKVSTWAQLRPLLQERRAAVGFVGIDVHAPTMLGAAHNIHAPAHNRAVLHNCVGMWWGCVPLNTPSVLYHTGHWAMEELKDTWLAERLLHSVQDWLSTLDTCALNSTAHA